MTEIKIPLDASLVHSLLSSETEGVQRLLKQVLEAILEARATDIAGAGRYERSEDRKYQRNGYIEKWITFRIGRLKIRIPQLRGDSLIDRGLKGIKFITSDQHQGLVNAADECFPESSWNRCQTHFTRNLLSHVPEQYHDDVLEDLHSIYNCKSHRRAMKKANEVILKYGSSSEESLRYVNIDI
jgi:transposase-like protein